MKPVTTSKRYYVLACEVLFREICLCAAKSSNIIDVSFEKQVLHDLGDKLMSSALQDKINQLDHDKYDAILLGYGLCNNGIVNLHAPIPIVVPRAHDCITLLMGSKEMYSEYFSKNPGAYYQTSGWLERSIDKGKEDTIPQQLGMGKSYEDYAAEYGEENAEYLMSILSDYLVNYTKVTFINNGVGDIEGIRETSKEWAKTQDWEYEEVEGSLCLMERLLNGDWNEEDFLVIPPSHIIVPSNDDSVITSTPKASSEILKERP